MDALGTLAFATTAGDIGVVHGDSVWRATAVCGASRMTRERAAVLTGRTLPTVAGLSPLRPGALVIACGSGTIVALESVPAEGWMGGKGEKPNL
jgi:hypothetical protein